jgi:hypothetical protein
MTWVYSCPHCGGVLNPEKTVMLVGEQGDDRIMVGLHPKPGNYRVSVHPGFEITAGSQWDFVCPLCQRTLVTDVAPNLCCLDMVTGDVKHRVYFSRVAGERATFVISAEGIERFGEHVGRHSLEMLGHV